MRAFLSYDVAADILISGFEHGMRIYLRMVSFSLLVCSLSLSSFVLGYILLICFSRFIEDFELDYIAGHLLVSFQS